MIRSERKYREICVVKPVSQAEKLSNCSFNISPLKINDFLSKELSHCHMAKHERETESDNFNYLSVIHFSDFLFNMSRKEKLYFYWVKRRLKMKEACLKKKKGTC